MTTPGATRALSVATLVGALLSTHVARAGEVQAETGVDAFSSTWRGDWGAGGKLRFGYRFAHLVAADLAVWEHYATVNQRVNTGLTIGATGYLPLGPVRPMLRLYVIHQHEESIISIQDHPLGTIAGIGAGIRHRAGMGGDLGVEAPILLTPWGDYHVTAAGSLTWFPDRTLGPGLYYGLSAGFGLNYSL